MRILRMKGEILLRIKVICYMLFILNGKELSILIIFQLEYLYFDVIYIINGERVGKEKEVK